VNWHELKNGRSIAIDAETFYVKAKNKAETEAKQTLLFYPSKTIFFQIDDRTNWIQFDGHRHDFETQEKRDAFILSLNECFPQAHAIDARQKEKYPYKPQIVGLIVVNVALIVALSSRGSYYDSSGMGHRVGPGDFANLLTAIPLGFLLTGYCVFSIAVFIKIFRTSERLQHETIYQVTKR
jgi:hypothetical protein